MLVTRPQAIGMALRRFVVLSMPNNKKKVAYVFRSGFLLSMQREFSFRPISNGIAIIAGPAFAFVIIIIARRAKRFD